MHPTAVDDQLVAASHATRAALAAATARSNHAEEVALQHVEIELTRLLVHRIRRAPGLCEHTAAAPAPLWWSPGHTTARCCDCWLLTRTRDLDDLRAAGDVDACHLCARAVDVDHGQALFAIGPVTVVATLCSTCATPGPVAGHRHDPSEVLTDLADALQDVWDQA